jgi:hypothetical protein
MRPDEGSGQLSILIEWRKDMRMFVSRNRGFVFSLATQGRAARCRLQGRPQQHQGNGTRYLAIDRGIE